MRALKELWTLLMVVVLGVPGIVIGYLARFFVNGLSTGYNLQARLHNPNQEDDNEPR